MLKNYIVNEVITMEMATSISSININEHFYEFIPYNVDLVKSINHYLQALYVDFCDIVRDNITIFDLNVHAVTELRGNVNQFFPLSNRRLNYVINECIAELIENDSDCLLIVIWNDYESHKKRQRKEK
jgi:hypothetical protein